MNLILIVFFSVFSYARAVSDEDKRCAWGESFWCSSIENAKVCQAIDHCKDTVWTNQRLGKDASEVCQFCEAVVEDVVQFIEENKTETELMNFLASACDLVPDKTMSSQCKLIVESYTPVIINLIKEKVEPQVVCGLIGLCKGFKDSVEHQKSIWTNEQIKTKDAVICADCKKFAQDFKEWLTSTATEQQIANQIDQMFCKYLGTMEGECKNLVQLFLPEIMQFFSDSVNADQFCQPFCGKSIQEIRNFFISLRLRKSPLFSATKQGSTEDCTICKTIMGDLQNLDRDKNVQDEIENLIKTEICARLSNYKSECELTVNLYAPELFELLATELDPVARCQSFGFCPAIQRPPKVHISAECVLCEFVMKELKSLIGDNATEAEIIAALEKVCKILPSTIRDQCTSFVDIYGKAVINLILQDISPEQICTILGLCNSSSISTALYSSTSATKCEICATLVGYVEALIDQNSTVMEIDRVVMKICNFLPDSMKQECSAIIQEFGGLIVHYVATSIPPKEVCTLIKLCPAEFVKMELLVPAQKNQASYYKCSYGPSYWCTSQANAELCQAVDHCKKYVW